MAKQAAKDVHKCGQATNGTLNEVAAGVRRPFVTERRTASEAAGSTVPVIRKPHPALCHPGGSSL
ncbi:unnamed protein product [Musa textilis]